MTRTPSSTFVGTAAGFGLSVLLSCAPVAAQSDGAAPRSNITSGCVNAFNPAVDYFPNKAAIEDAANFRVTYARSYKIVRVKTSSGGPDDAYVLVQCGTPAPALTGDLAGAEVVTVPVTSLFSLSATHLPLLVDLGRLDVLTGVSRLTDLVGDEILRRAATGQVREFAASSVIDAELVVSAHPGLFLTAGAPSAALAVIRAAGIPVAADTEWLESTALARAEWLKYMALFLNEEGHAETQYRAMKTRYLALRARATAEPPDTWPRVMTGRSNQGVFTTAGGRSYVAALIKDAGGRYVWADNTAASSIPVDFEAELSRASNADIWINGGGWTSLQTMVADEPRYAAFAAYRHRQVWVYERRMSATGANDYWTRSVTHPDVVLADLVKIFHPALVPDHAFEWYMPVPAQ